MAFLSDADGGFRVTNLPATGYMIYCEKAGYLPATQSMSPPPANSPDGKSTQTIAIKMTSQAALEGTVVDDRDVPAENTMIQLVSQQVVNGRRQLQPTAPAAPMKPAIFVSTGSPGRYYISITGRLNGARRAKPLAYPPLYFPNATDIAATQAIDLKAGDEQQIKYGPEPVPAFEVRGVVVTDAPNVSVSLVRQGTSQMFQQSSGLSTWDAPSRSFRISHVTPGMFLLTAITTAGTARRPAP